MDKNLKFSVLISVYTKEKSHYLEESLESIWDKQTLKPSEIVIVQDGPLNESIQTVLENYARNKPVKFIINEQNLGLSSSLHKGLLACSYEYIARMDTDDICFPNRFETQINFLINHPEIDILGSYAIKIDELGFSNNQIMKVPHGSDIIKYIWTSPIIHPAVIYKKKAIIYAGNYDNNPPKGTRHEDYELWFKCAYHKLHFENINKPLLYYRYIPDTFIKNNFKVSWNRYLIAFKWSLKLKCSLIAYFGILIPLIRSILPKDIQKKFNDLMIKFNPRVR